VNEVEWDTPASNTDWTKS